MVMSCGIPLSFCGRAGRKELIKVEAFSSAFRREFSDERISLKIAASRDRMAATMNGMSVMHSPENRIQELCTESTMLTVALE